jgi:hypothetical protein
MAELVRIDPPGRKPPRASPPLPPPSRRGYLVRGTIAPVFVERHALAPEDAIDFAPRSPQEAKAFAAMKARGVVRAAGGGGGSTWSPIRRTPKRGAGRRRRG